MIDLEKGSDFVNALKYDIVRTAEAEGKLPVVILKALIDTIKEANVKKGDYVYKYIAIDTVTALEDIVLPLANKMYRDTPRIPGACISNYTRKILLIAGKSL